MKLSILAGFLATTNAAILTQYFTAATSTHWVYYTTGTVLTTRTSITTHSGLPPNIGTPNATPVTSSSRVSTSSTSVASSSESGSSSTTLPTTTTASTIVTSVGEPSSSEGTTVSTAPTISSSATSPSTTSPSTTSSSTTSSSSSSTTSSSSTSVATTTASSSSSSAASTSATSTANANTPTVDVQFANEILAEHNRLRALHSTNPLVWNNTLATYAADYAARAFDCNNVKLIHSNGPYGENLAAGYVGGVDPTDAWYNEIHDYDYSNPGYSSATGHFTQLIWAASTQLGCARVMCDNAWRQYTICEYWTRGNIVGTDTATTQRFFTENVKPLAT